MDSLRQRDRRRHAVERLVAVKREHRLQANSDRALRQLRCARRERDDRPVLARAKPVHEAGELAEPDIVPADLGRLQPPPPQRERRAYDFTVFGELETRRYSRYCSAASIERPSPPMTVQVAAPLGSRTC